jgi:hypothetical protein
MDDIDGYINALANAGVDRAGATQVLSLLQVPQLRGLRTVLVRFLHVLDVVHRGFYLTDDAVAQLNAHAERARAMLATPLGACSASMDHSVEGLSGY